MLGLLLVLGAIPQVGPELPLDSPLHGPAAGRQFDTAIAMDSIGGVSVWIDSRTGTATVFGARLDSSGGIVDQRGLLIAGGLGGRKPRIALTPNNAYVVFLSTGAGASQAYIVSVNRSTGLATSPLRLSTLATDCNSVDVITDSGNAWVFWGQNPSVFRAVVSLSGGVIGVVSAGALGASPGPVAASTSTVSGWPRSFSPTRRTRTASIWAPSTAPVRLPPPES